MTISRVFVTFCMIFGSVSFVPLSMAQSDDVSPLSDKQYMTKGVTPDLDSPDTKTVLAVGDIQNVDDGEELESTEGIDGDAAIDNGSFFDAEDLVPQARTEETTPQLVDPKRQPASRFVLVEKNHSPDEKEARLVSAERAMSLGRYESALHLFNILYEKNKKDSRVLMGRAIVLQKLGRFDEAMVVYEALSKIEPDNVEFQVNMLGLLSQRFPAVALRRLLDLREKDEGHVGLVAQIAVCYAALGDLKEAVQYLGIASSMEPYNATHVYNMAVVLDSQGDKKQAVSYYERALEIDSVHGSGRSIARDVVYERLAELR